MIYFWSSIFYLCYLAAVGINEAASQRRVKLASKSSRYPQQLGVSATIPSYTCVLRELDLEDIVQKQ